MSLLLLLSSYDPMKYVDAWAATTGNFSAAIDVRTPHSPLGETNVFASSSASPEDRASQQGSASVNATGAFFATLYTSSQQAVALVHEVSSVNFLPFDATVDFSAECNVVASGSGAVEARSAALADAACSGVGDLATFAQNGSLALSNFAIVAVGRFAAALPPRSVSSPATLGDGRASAGSPSTPGGRSAEGTPSAPGGRASNGGVSDPGGRSGVGGATGSGGRVTVGSVT